MEERSDSVGMEGGVVWSFWIEMKEDKEGAEEKQILGVLTRVKRLELLQAFAYDESSRHRRA